MRRVARSFAIRNVASLTSRLGGMIPHTVSAHGRAEICGFSLTRDLLNPYCAVLRRPPGSHNSTPFYLWRYERAVETGHLENRYSSAPICARLPPLETLEPLVRNVMHASSANSFGGRNQKWRQQPRLCPKPLSTSAHSAGSSARSSIRAPLLKTLPGSPAGSSRYCCSLSSAFRSPTSSESVSAGALSWRSSSLKIRASSN